MRPFGMPRTGISQYMILHVRGVLCVQPPVAASEYADELQRIPQLSALALGPVFKSAEPLLLTEEETEYSIALVVHIFQEHILLQFNCSNTVAEQVLENVNVVVDLSEAVSVTC